MTGEAWSEKLLIFPTSNQAQQMDECERSKALQAAELRDTVLNEQIRWRITEDGEHIELCLITMSGSEFSFVVRLSDFWALLISFVGSTAAALAEYPLERKRDQGFMPGLIRSATKRLSSIIWARSTPAAAGESKGAY